MLLTTGDVTLILPQRTLQQLIDEFEDETSPVDFPSPLIDWMYDELLQEEKGYQVYDVPIEDMICLLKALVLINATKKRGR